MFGSVCFKGVAVLDHHFWVEISGRVWDLGLPQFFGGHAPQGIFIAREKNLEYTGQRVCLPEIPEEFYFELEFPDMVWGEMPHVPTLPRVPVSPVAQAYEGGCFSVQALDAWDTTILIGQE